MNALIDWLRKLLGGVRPPPSPPPSPPPAGDAKGQLVAALNRVRSVPLTRDGALDGTAQRWADTLAPGGQAGLTHGDWLPRLVAAHPGGLVNEDLAGGQTTADQVVAGWMSDPPHRRSVTDPTYRVCGVGIAPLAGGGYVWVLDLGG